MNFKIQWIGISKSGNNRIWGHLLDSDSSYWNCTTFWGQKDGKIYFQGTKKDAAFKKNLKRKLEKYKQDTSLADRVLKEYEMHIMLRKLKGE